MLDIGAFLINRVLDLIYGLILGFLISILTTAFIYLIWESEAWTSDNKNIQTNTFTKLRRDQAIKYLAEIEEMGKKIAPFIIKYRVHFLLAILIVSSFPPAFIITFNLG